MDNARRSSFEQELEEKSSFSETKLDESDSKTSEIKLKEDNQVQDQSINQDNQDQDGMQENDIDIEHHLPPPDNNSKSIKLIKRQNRILIVIVGMMILLFCIVGVLALFVLKTQKGTSTTDETLTAGFKRFEDQHETVIEMIVNLTVTLQTVIERVSAI